MVLLCVLKHDSCRSGVKDRHIVSNIYYFSARFGYNWIKKKKIKEMYHELLYTLSVCKELPQERQFSETERVNIIVFMDH